MSNLDYQSIQSTLQQTYNQQVSNALSKIIKKCNLKSLQLKTEDTKYISLQKKEYKTLIANTTPITIFTYIPQFLFNNLYKQIQTYKYKDSHPSHYNKLLNSFTDKIYGIWVYAYYTPELTKILMKTDPASLKYSTDELTANNIDDFVMYHKKIAAGYKVDDESPYKFTDETFKSITRLRYELYSLSASSKQQPKLNIKQNKSYIDVWIDDLNKTSNISKIQYTDEYIDGLLDEYEEIPQEDKEDKLYIEDNTLQTNEITDKIILDVSTNFKESGYNVDYLKSIQPKNERWSCYNFIANLANRDLPYNFYVPPYISMLFEVMSGNMPFKKVHLKNITQNYNAFTSNLLEIKSTCDKSKALKDSLTYNPENYMTYQYFELCEYIISDYQRFVFDIDCEFEKIKKIKNGEDIVIEHNYNKETHDQLLLEMNEIKRLIKELSLTSNFDEEPKLYAYIMFGTHENDIYPLHQDERKIEWCKDIFTDMECMYEYNNKATKVISVHIGVSNICYHRNQNDAFRRYFNTHVLSNGNKFEMVDSTIYNKTQHAWRFAYSRKNNKRSCQLMPIELQQNEEILYNLFAYPDETDTIVNIPKEFLVEDKYYSQQKEIISSDDPHQTYLNKLKKLYEKKEIEIFSQMSIKRKEDFEYLLEPAQENEIYDSQIDPRLLQVLNYVRKNNTGYPNIQRAVLYFVNVFRNYYSDIGECIELLLKIDYYHTNGTLNTQSTQFIPSLVKFGFKQKIKPLPIKTDLSIYNKDIVRLFGEAVWKEHQLKHYIRKMIFKIEETLYLKTLTEEKDRIRYKATSFDSLNYIFNTGFWIMKKCTCEDKLVIRLYHVSAKYFIQSMVLPEYTTIQIAHPDSYNHKNLYDKTIGFDKEGKKIFDLKEKKYAIHDMKPENRPKQITNVLRSILNNNALNEKQLTERINYFESIFAYKIQNPDVRIDIAPIICSEEGIGKNTYFNILKTGLGYWVKDDLSWNTATSNFNAGQQMNIIRAYDEVTSTKSSLDLLKRLITAPTESVNEKFEKRCDIINIALKCFLTNNFNNNIISKTDENRRFLYYLPTTRHEEGQEIVQENWWRIKDEERTKLGKSYFNYLLRLDVSKFDPSTKLNTKEEKYRHIDDMYEFRDSVMASADYTTQFINEIVKILEIPKVQNMTFVPTSLIEDLGNMCKNRDSELPNIEFDFEELTKWYHANILEDYTWRSTAIKTRLENNESKYRYKKINFNHKCNTITPNDKNKEIITSYYQREVRGFYV